MTYYKDMQKMQETMVALLKKTQLTGIPESVLILALKQNYPVSESAITKHIELLINTKTIKRIGETLFWESEQFDIKRFTKDDGSRFE